MTRAAWILAAFLFLSGALVVIGVSLIHVPAALIVAGLLLAGWSALVFVETSR